MAKQSPGVPEGSATAESIEPSPAPTGPSAGAGFRKHGAWALAGRLTNLVMVAGGAFVFARAMGREEFGRFAFLQSSLTLLGLVATAGLGTAALRLLTQDSVANRSPWGTARWIATAVGITAPLAALLAATAWACGLGDAILGDSTRLVMLLFALAVAAKGVHQPLTEVLRATGRLGAANLLDGVNGGPLMNGLLLAGILLWASLAPVSAVQGLAVYAAAALFVAQFGLYWACNSLNRAAREASGQPAQSTDHAEDRPAVSWGVIAAIAAPVAASSLIVFSTEQLDLLVAGFLFDDTSVADYAAAKRTSLLLRIPFAVMNMAVAGMITRLYLRRESDELSGLLGGAAVLAGFPAIAIGIPLLLAPEWTIGLLFGPGFESAATPLRILILGQFATVLGGSSQQALMFTEFQRTAMTVNLISCLVAAVALPLSASVGLTGLATAAALIASGRSVALWCWARRRVGVNTAPSLAGAAWLAKAVRGHNPPATAGR